MCLYTSVHLYTWQQSLLFNNIQWESRQTDFPIMDSCGGAQNHSVPLQLTVHSPLSLLSPSKPVILTGHSRTRVYSRCRHMVRVPKVFVYTLMCDSGLLLDTSGSCFEIESVWSNSININITLNSDPYFLGSTGNIWTLCVGLVMARICPRLWVWHQLSLSTDCSIQCGIKTKAEQTRVHVRLFFWIQVGLLQACERCEVL